MNQHQAKNHRWYVNALFARIDRRYSLAIGGHRGFSTIVLCGCSWLRSSVNGDLNFSRAAILLLASLFTKPVNAIVGDAIRPFVEVSYAHDNNLLRLPPSQLNGGNGADSTKTLDTGILLDKSFGRQHISGNVKFSRTRFEKFTGLDNDAKDIQASWNWQIGNHLEGNVGSQYKQGLAPFSELRSNVRDVKTQKNSFLDAKLRLKPSWSLHAGVTRQSLSYDLPTQQIGNRIEDAQEVGLDYLPSSGSSVGGVFRRTRATYPVQQQLGALVVANSYRQNDVKLKVDWILSSKSRLQFLGGVVQREYDVFQSRNKTAPSVRVTGNWQPTSKINMVLSGYHEISPSDDLTINYSVVSGVSLSSSWDLLTKVRLDALLRRENRDFNAASAFSASLPFNRVEKSRFGSLQLTWSPQQNLQLTASLFRDDLDSTVAQRAYRAAGAVVGLRAAF